MEKKSLSKITNSGSIANKNGKVLENFIEDLLKRENYEELNPSNTIFAWSKLPNQKKAYAKQVNIGKTIYDTKQTSDFVIYHPDKYPNLLVIECKWQQVGGTVDEKFPYLVLNINNIQYETIIILDGNGYKKGAEKWLRKQVGNNLKGVYSMNEFIAINNKEHIL